MNENQYSNYQSMVTAVTTGLGQLGGVCRHLSMEGQADQLSGLGNRLQEHVFSVGIMGEFKRGKSTVINALLGMPVVPADIMPCSATLNYIRWDATRHAQVRFKDGSVKDVSVEELSDYVTKITEESEKMAASVEDAVVYYPCPLCKNGVQIIDTPGLNDDERMNTISESVIPMLDAIIMVTVPGSPFGISEAEFVRNKVLTSDLGRIIFVVNKIDQVDEDERDRILDHIRGKIRSSVLDKMKLVYGEDSPEVASAREKLSGIHIIGVSAKQALKAKTKNDDRLLAESGFEEFEKTLSRLLTEERGTLELIHPVNQLLSTSKEALETIDTRMGALNMEAEEFEKIQTEAIQKIEETRSRKKDEIKQLKARGKNLFYDLMPQVEEAYQEVENDADGYVNGLNLDNVDMSSQQALEEFGRQVEGQLSQQLEDSMSVACERLLNQVDTQLGRDVKELENFGQEFNSMVESIHLDLSTSRSVTVSTASAGSDLGTTAKNALIEVGAIYGSTLLFQGALPGVGGILSGWREHGLKGAVVGGVSGLGLGLLAGAAALSVGIVGLPFALIMGAASSFGGRTITRLLFGRKEKPETAPQVSTETLREALYNGVKEAVAGMRQERQLEKWLRETCESAYDGVADSVDQEWENTLSTLEGSLAQIRSDLQLSAVNKEKAQAELNEYAETIGGVVQAVAPIQKKLKEALK